MNTTALKDSIIGMIVGDALGFPYFGAHRNKLNISDLSQQNATWSSDSTIALCITEAMKYNFDKNEIKELFEQLLNGQHWAMPDHLKGLSTNILANIKSAIAGKNNTEFVKKTDVIDNITLLTVIPLTFYSEKMPINLRFTLLKQIVAYTNPVNLALLSSLYLEEFLRSFLQGNSLMSAYFTVQEILPIIWRNMNQDTNELEALWSLLNGEIWSLAEEEIRSSQDIVDTLKAMMWIIMRTRSYIEAVLKAVNLGGDTTTLGALTGAVAAIIYSGQNIPQDWIDRIYLIEQIQRFLDNILE